MGHATEVEVVRTAKKPHSCSWCAQRIDAGQSYIRWRWYDGGDASTVKMHPECHEAMRELIAIEGGNTIEFSPGESPRGCCCGYDHGCPKCAARKADAVIAA